MTVLTEAKKYEVNNVEWLIGQSGCITFLNVFNVSGKILRIQAETYKMDIGRTDPDIIKSARGRVESVEPEDSINIICKDEKKRRPSTLEKIGVSLEDLQSGMEEREVALAVSEYFIKNDGVIVACKAYASISAVNKVIIASSYKTISNDFFDIRMMAKKCDEKYTDRNCLNDIKETFSCCMMDYRRLKRIEKNKKACVVNYAYFWQNSYRKYTEWIFCDTSVGKVYYDILTEKWGITKKESKEMGLVIEGLDTEDIERQVLAKYRAKDMRDLVAILRKKREEKESAKMAV